MYHVQEFANLAGVTVRTLHYYDQSGLLKPARHKGVRLYDTDLQRFMQEARRIYNERNSTS